MKLIYYYRFAALIFVLICSCGETTRSVNSTEFSELESVWQYLKVYSIFEDRLSGSAFDYTSPQAMFDAIADTLYDNTQYTRYASADHDQTGRLLSSQMSISTIQTQPVSDSTLYLSINLFSTLTYVDFRAKLEQYPRYKNVIIDLRNNPGGDLKELDSILEYLLPPFTNYIEATWRDYDNRKKKPLSFNWQPKATGGSANDALANKKVSVLINRYSASASEILVAALKDSKNSLIIGEKSFGKGIGQIKLTRRDRDTLLITFVKFRGLQNRIGDYHLKGINPDKVPDSIMKISVTMNQFPKDVFNAAKMMEPSLTLRNFKFPLYVPTPVSFNPVGFRVVEESSVIF